MLGIMLLDLEHTRVCSSREKPRSEMFRVWLSVCVRFIQSVFRCYFVMNK